MFELSAINLFIETLGGATGSPGSIFDKVAKRTTTHFCLPDQFLCALKSERHAADQTPAEVTVAVTTLANAPRESVTQGGAQFELQREREKILKFALRLPGSVPLVV